MPYIVINSIAFWALSYECFRRLQALSYRPQRGYGKLLLSPYFAVLIVVCAVSVTVKHCALYPFITSIAYAASAVVFAAIPRKSPLKFTKRIWRMLIVQLALSALLCYFGVDSYCVVGLPIVTLCSLVLCLPIDLAISRHYIVKAQSKLNQSGVTVIAITGSYGKTSVKDMLASLLENSACPLGSCNTPLGIASYINKANLSNVKYLVLEFGARRRGDIAQLCKLYRPEYGIVTGVCPQHLSTFKTWNNVVAAKRELVDNLPADGVCVLNAMDETATSYVNAGVCRKVASNQLAAVALEDITVSGARLSVCCDKANNQVQLPQITAHVTDTFSMCLTMCLTLGQSLTDTLSCTVNVKQTPHRMEISKAPNCYIIDDGYNASVTGIQSAAHTLSYFKQFKVVITQGLVECGRKRRELNVKCGQTLGKACNVAVVLGANKKYLAEGLSQTDCKVIYAKNLKQAVELSQPYLQGESSILLFQNDLPD